MKKQNSRPKFKKQIVIKGSVLFLVGPIGTFFSRLSNYLEKNNVETYKIIFPLHEYGFKKKSKILYRDEISEFKEFLEMIIIKKKIKHIFMYGNVLIPHKQALTLCSELNRKGYFIYTHIFELGYLRPNFVTLEDKGVNYSSSFLLDRNFYEKQSSYEMFPVPVKKMFRIKKIWKLITFINHSFKNYKMVEFEHKLQPKPIYLWFQLKGFFLKFFYKISEKKLKINIFSKSPFFLAVLQVETDSQISKGSKFLNNNEFIYKVIKDFRDANLKNAKLVFKHHPRDRGYNNYLRFIVSVSTEFNITDKVSYIHDYPLSKIFRNNLCKGTVLINSTVGYQSLFHSVPIKALGIAPYNFGGLSDQKNLVSFFINPQKVNELLFNKFYKYILENSQINGNFDGYFPYKSLFVFPNKQ